MVIKELQDLIKRHEGLRLKPYRCSAGKLTIGYGHNLDDKGITENTAQFIFDEDLSECTADLNEIFSGQFQGFPIDIQIVLMDMRFQLGPNRFRKFQKMIRAIRGNNLKEMVRQMKDSKWYWQVPNRAQELVGMVEAFV